MQGVDFIPPEDGWANSQRSPLHATPSPIVNSSNKVNLINFRAGSHLTFSSIFSPTSKTSISSSKMGSSEWQSLITPTYLKLRVNLFSGFWMCSLQLHFQRRPPKSKEIKFIFEKCPEFFLFSSSVSISWPQSTTQSIVVPRFLFFIIRDHNCYRSWNHVL